MGSGKSTIGPILANTLGWDFHDLDKVIEDSAGVTIKEIFANEGEQVFRRMESEKLLEISAGDNLVVSLGGGTVTFPGNMQVINNNGLLIYLKTSLESVSRRLMYKNDRPLVKVDDTKEYSKEEILKNIRDLFESRKPFYEKSDFTVDTDQVPVGKTVDFLTKLILSHFKGKPVEKNSSRP